MSPDAERRFEAQWPLLERRARSLLSRKRVPACDREDLLQEVAMRLLRMWDSIDQTRPLWPLTSTILLNLLRDRSRVAPRDDVVGVLPDVQAPHDVERAGLARVELERVRRAMDHLSRSHRLILMQELHWSEAAAASPAEKMLRMRARRKLRSILEKVSGLVALRSRRLTELSEKLFALREGAATTASCVLCLMLGIGGVVATPSVLTPQASALPVRSAVGPAVSLPVGGEIEAHEAAVAASLQEGVAEARRAQQAARLDAARHRTRTKKVSSADHDAGLLPALPGQDDGSIPVPSHDVSADTGPPEVSPPDPGDAPTVEPPSPPAPPAPPSPPAPPVNVLPATDGLVDKVESALKA